MSQLTTTDINNKVPTTRDDYNDKTVYVFDFIDTHNIKIEVEASSIAEAKSLVIATLEQKELNHGGIFQTSKQLRFPNCPVCVFADKV